MGAKLARPDRPAIAYAGEGAWGMSLNEVLTCIRERIPTTAVVFNNGQWGAEKKNQVSFAQCLEDEYILINRGYCIVIETTLPISSIAVVVW